MIFEARRGMNLSVKLRMFVAFQRGSELAGLAAAWPARLTLVVRRKGIVRRASFASAGLGHTVLGVRCSGLSHTTGHLRSI